MSIEFWIGLWKIVLIAGLGLFATLAIVVTIGGALDVIKLFRTLKQQHVQDASDDPASGRSSD